jgi:AhpD family alkylhydroperoxidase
MGVLDESSTTREHVTGPGKRVFLDKQSPAAYQALTRTAQEVRKVAAEAGLERGLVELVNIRVSQINGCAFCLDLHTRAALTGGETTQRLAVLSAWRLTELFTAREQAALALAESVTLLGDRQVADSAYSFAREHLSTDETAAVAWIALTMNAFNRLSIFSHHPVRPRA